MVEKNDIPANKLARLSLLRDLEREKFDVKKSSRLVKRDAAITFRLLRLANSAMYAYHEEVQSVETALCILGEKTFRRIAALAIAVTLNEGGPAEILRTALTRARFCELAAGAAGLPASEQYLMGLFSLLPAMLRIPMEQAILTLPLGNTIKAALLGEQIPERAFLSWIEASERHDLTFCDAIENSIQSGTWNLAACAREAAEWADQSLIAAD